MAPDYIRYVRDAHEYMEDRLPPKWRAVLTVKSDIRFAELTLFDGRGELVRRSGLDDVAEKERGRYYPRYSKHVVRAWKRFLKEGK